MVRNGGQKDAGKMRMVTRIMSFVLWEESCFRSGQNAIVHVNGECFVFGEL